MRISPKQREQMTKVLVRLENVLRTRGRDEDILSARAYCERSHPGLWQESSKKTRESLVKDIFKNISLLITEAALLREHRLGIVPVNSLATQKHEFIVPTDVEKCKKYIRPGKGYTGIYITNREHGAMLMAYTQNQRTNANGKLKTQRIREEGFDRNRLLSPAVKEQLLLG